jgi:hypothetical protein
MLQKVKIMDIVFFKIPKLQQIVGSFVIRKWSASCSRDTCETLDDLLFQGASNALPGDCEHIDIHVPAAEVREILVVSLPISGTSPISHTLAQVELNRATIKIATILNLELGTGEMCWVSQCCAEGPQAVGYDCFMEGTLIPHLHVFEKYPLLIVVINHSWYPCSQPWGVLNSCVIYALLGMCMGGILMHCC